MLVRPFYWMSNDYDASSYLGGASFFVIRSRTSLFGVIANHAIDDFCAQTPLGTTAHLNNHLYDPTKNLIARSGKNGWDVATFGLSGYDANRALILPIRWEPRMPAQGKGVVIAGYMCSKERVEIGERSLFFDKLCNPLVATRVTADMIEVEIDARVLRKPKQWANLLEYPKGFSGCPLLTVTEDVHEPLLAGGVVTNFVAIDAERGYFEARPLAAFMREDGTFI